MSKAIAQVKAGEHFTEDDRERLNRESEKDRELLQSLRSKRMKRIAGFAPWFKDDKYSWMRLAAELSKRLPMEQMDSWMELTEEELFGVIDALCENPWIDVALEDCELDRSNMRRHADDPSKPILKVGRGAYQVRKSSLREYIKRSRWSKYGEE
ncbi:MAG: hypothetical protein KGQ51_18710 [Planctomycetes bacterium]|nr:hypothetical protein [Planctomycetota bacterium]